VAIEYVLRAAGEEHRFEVDSERASKTDYDATDEPFWVKLDYNKCTNCPLSETEHTNCPAAVDARRITETYKDMVSTETVQVEVRTPERTYVKETDSQSALRGLLGLVMATSGCPTLSHFKGLAQTHLPFSNIEETLLRVVGAYLIQQFIRNQEGEEPDWELKNLNTFYEELQEVNRCFKGRIDAASQQDANMNALGSLVYLAMGVSFSLEDQLANLREMVFN
jgi:hypothetical protein